jgi:DNA mismatch endonuclease (patch repair protein)
MTDIVDRKTRSRMMSGIRSRNTRIEITVRKRLFSLGFRYRINDRRLPGKPDMVFPKYRAVIFTHGCFWHGHDCKYFRLPSSNRDFWQAKISRNKKRDEDVVALLHENGRFERIRITAAATAKRQLPELDAVTSLLSDWLQHGTEDLEVHG